MLELLSPGTAGVSGEVNFRLGSEPRAGGLEEICSDSRILPQ